MTGEVGLEVSHRRHGVLVALGTGGIGGKAVVGVGYEAGQPGDAISHDVDAGVEAG
jgi:hypothetical protein